MNPNQDDDSIVVFSPETNGFKMKTLREQVKLATGFGGKKLKAAVLREINRMQPVADAGYTNLRSRGYKVEAITEGKTGTVTFKLTPPDEAVVSVEKLERENAELRAKLDALLAARDGSGERA